MEQLTQNEAEIIKKLRHPVRLQILKVLENVGSLNYSMLKNKCNISSSTLYYHLKRLENLVKKNDDNSYSLSTEGISSLDIFYKISGKDQKISLDDRFSDYSYFNDYIDILSNPIRRKILLMFQNRKEIRYSEFMKDLKLSSGILYYHLRYFEKITEITSEKSYKLTEVGETLLKSLNNFPKKDIFYESTKAIKSSLSSQDLTELNLKGDYHKIIEIISPNFDEIEKTYLFVDSLISTGKIDEAEATLDKLLSNLEDESNLIYGLFYSCYCLIIRGEYSKAQKYLDNALELYNSFKSNVFDKDLQLKHLFSLKQIELFIHTNKLDNAERIIDELLEGAEKLKDNKLKGEIYHNYGEILWKKGELNNALTNFELSKQFFLKTKNPEFIGRSNLLIARTHYHLGDTSLALKTNLEALELLNINKNPLSIGQAQYSIATLHRHRQEFDKATDYLEKSLETYILIGNPNYIVLVLTGLGSIKTSISDFIEANKYFQKALDYEEYVENKDSIAVVYKFIAYLRESEDNYEEAINYYLKAEEIFIETNRIMHRMDCLRLLCGIYYSKGELSKTKDVLNLILELNKESKTPRFEIPTNIRLGELLLDRGLYPEALEFFKKALELAEQWEDQENLYISKLHSAICILYLGDLVEAKIMLEGVLENSISIKNENRLAKSIINIAKIDKELKKNDWNRLRKIFESYEYSTPRFTGYFEIYKGLEFVSKEEWSEGLKSFEKALLIKGLDFFEKIYCYEMIAEITFNKWKANSTEENLNILHELLNKWEDYCIARQLLERIIKINLIKARILIYQLNFSKAKEILVKILKESEEKLMKRENDLINKEIQILDEKINQIKL